MNTWFVVFLIVAAVFGAIIICDLRANQPTRSANATEKPPPAEPAEDISGHPRSLQHALADLREKYAGLTEGHRARSQLARMIGQLEAELEDRDKPRGQRGRGLRVKGWAGYPGAGGPKPERKGARLRRMKARIPFAAKAAAILIAAVIAGAVVGVWSGMAPWRRGEPPPLGATAGCRDGTWTWRKHPSAPGTCSQHDGVARYYRKISASCSPVDRYSEANGTKMG
jgi:hypothetical protein